MMKKIFKQVIRETVADKMLEAKDFFDKNIPKTKEEALKKTDDLLKKAESFIQTKIKDLEKEKEEIKKETPNVVNKDVCVRVLQYTNSVGAYHTYMTDFPGATKDDVFALIDKGVLIVRSSNENYPYKASLVVDPRYKITKVVTSDGIVKVTVTIKAESVSPVLSE